ncbi:tectonic-like complex member MKS1 isoform X2 [Daktulosphaira vitifoliae]|uniref:tectonic-like complex member MKS1 isoform X2 n=1 Tax=Daktulosphaira vitifoliae TaxID=58002 RepID=UPI0021AA1CD6|nr:tectonic-like complex member MKS1 isoform X2 [Daktulosphaira vitifoliae]
MDNVEYDVGTYRCEGPIEHFKFRISLEISRTSFHHKNTDLEKKHKKRIEKIFKWMEKSPEEILNQNDLDETSSSIEGKLHDSHLLTDINNHHSGRAILHDVVNIDNIITKSFKQIGELKINSKNINIFKKTFVDEAPSNNLKLQNRLPYSNHIMHIILDLDNSNNETEMNRHVLASLYWNPNSHILTILPDFTNTNSAGYILPISTVKDSCFEYRFWIENIPTETKDLLYNNLYLTKFDCHDFHMPANDTVDIVGEIISASGFEYDSLFVRYQIYIPSEWKCSHPSSLHGVTNICQRNNNFMSIFTHLFNATIILPENYESLKTQKLNSAFLIFEIYSIDTWRKERIEGYASYEIPINTSSKSLYFKKLVLETWLPLPRKVNDNLRRYFIGGSIKLANFSSISTPFSFNEKCLSKFGMEIEQKGSIVLRLGLLKQYHMPDKINSKSILSNDTQAAETLLNSVNNILARFKEARQRMLLACEPMMSSSH